MIFVATKNDKNGRTPKKFPSFGSVFASGIRDG
jgi:hypothetical protein